MSLHTMSAQKVSSCELIRTCSMLWMLNVIILLNIMILLNCTGAQWHHPAQFDHHSQCYHPARCYGRFAVRLWLCECSIVSQGMGEGCMPKHPCSKGFVCVCVCVCRVCVCVLLLQFLLYWMIKPVRLWAHCALTPGVSPCLGVHQQGECRGGLPQDHTGIRHNRMIIFVTFHSVI